MSEQGKCLVEVTSFGRGESFDDGAVGVDVGGEVPGGGGALQGSDCFFDAVGFGEGGEGHVQGGEVEFEGRFPPFALAGALSWWYWAC